MLFVILEMDLFDVFSQRLKLLSVITLILLPWLYAE
jgi:hypothetical protein